MCEIDMCLGGRVGRTAWLRGVSKGGAGEGGGVRERGSSVEMDVYENAEQEVRGCRRRSGREIDKLSA